MPYSKNQKILACIALSMKRGETARSYSEEASKMADSMTEKQLIDYCKGPIKKK